MSIDSIEYISIFLDTVTSAADIIEKNVQVLSKAVAGDTDAVTIAASSLTAKNTDSDRCS
jgi:hypothetical protein